MANFLIQYYLTVQQQAAEIFIKKNQDYGTDNIATSGEIGVTVRMGDKMSRLFTLYGVADGNPKIPQNESVEDTLFDIINYAIILLLLRRNLWPKITKTSWLKEQK